MMIDKREERFYINGGWREPIDHQRAPLEVISPVTGELIGTAPMGGPADVAAAVAAAHSAFPAWSALTRGEREALLLRVRSLYAADALMMQKLITWEMGSPAWFTAQTEHPLAIIDYYVNARHPSLRTEPGGVVEYVPVGVVGIITPWNMPQKTILMKAVPALLAGCTVVVKPAPETPFDALALAQIMDDAGIPPGVFNVVTGDGITGCGLADHADVDKVAFTGSTHTGRQIALMCAERIGRVSLELGGKSAMVILDDADVSALTPQRILWDCVLNNGQICSNQTRIIAPRARLQEIAQAVIDAFATFTVGDPADPAVHIGPLVRAGQQSAVNGYVTRAVDAGARVVFRHDPPPRPGWFVAPTVLETTPDMEVSQEEVFGPVVCLIPHDGDEDAVAIANGTRYGLDGSVWSADTARAAVVASQLRTGTVRINGADTGVNMPLGGFKQSGIGRELGLEGLRSFQEVRVVASA